MATRDNCGGCKVNNGFFSNISQQEYRRLKSRSQRLSKFDGLSTKFFGWQL